MCFWGVSEVIARSLVLSLSALTTHHLSYPGFAENVSTNNCADVKLLHWETALKRQKDKL